jgi:hypothetical protein
MKTIPSIQIAGVATALLLAAQLATAQDQPRRPQTKAGEPSREGQPDGQRRPGGDRPAGG